jgi:hypothetical protein
VTVKERAKIFPHFWYAKEAEEAARFYASIFPDSFVDRVTPFPSDSPSGPPGSVKVVDFTLFGQRFQMRPLIACSFTVRLSARPPSLVWGSSTKAKFKARAMPQKRTWLRKWPEMCCAVVHA